MNTKPGDGNKIAGQEAKKTKPPNTQRTTPPFSNDECPTHRIPDINCIPCLLAAISRGGPTSATQPQASATPAAKVKPQPLEPEPAAKPWAKEDPTGKLQVDFGSDSCFKTKYVCRIPCFVAIAS